MGISGSAGIRMSAGIFITLIFAVGSVVAMKFLQKKFPANADNEPQISYLCENCGKKVKKTVKFCPECGGKVVEKQTDLQADTTLPDSQNQNGGK